MLHQKNCRLVACAALITLFTQNARALSQTWEVTRGFASPDCMDKAVIMVNGEFPGPLLRVQPGEEIAITVKNFLPNEAIAVHFHGQNQMGTPYMDGSTMVSSCPTGPHQSFTYSFTAEDKPGTYMYHLHIGATRNTGLYGMFIIEERASDALYMSDLAGEHSLMLADWYHAAIDDIVTGLLSPAFRWPGDPNSLLINGKGQFGCVPETGVELPEYCSACPGLQSFEVAAGGKYRLRFANVAGLVYLNVAIENHTMTVIEADGHPVTPIQVSSLDISSGQRYSVLIEANQPADAYRISVVSRHRSGVRTTYATLRYDSIAAERDPGFPSDQLLDALHPAWDDDEFSYQQQAAYTGLQGANPPAPPADDVTKRVVLVGTQERFESGSQMNGGRPEDNCDSAGNTLALRWAVGRVTYEPERDAPVSVSVYENKTDGFTAERGYIDVKKGDVVDVVLQNYPACNGKCEAHPWHLHGHHFWVVGQGSGEWSGSAEQLGSLKSGSEPVYRDTVTLITDESTDAFESPRSGCGWVVMRFIADNPGAWNLHCHITWHTLMGMRSVIWYNDHSMPEPPAGFPCYNPEVADVAQLPSDDDDEPGQGGAGWHVAAPTQMILLLASLALAAARV